MKNLLVPVDFSENARNALAYAVEIANLFGSHIHLLHTYKVPGKAGMFISVEQYVLEDIRPDMEKWENWARENLRHGATISSAILRDNTVHAIVQLTGQENVDLIVMGTQGASGLKEVFLGSTTGAVLQQTSVSLLAIPVGFTFRPVHTVVLAVDDLDVSSHQVVAPLTRLAKRFKARVLVYHLETKPEDAGIDPSVDIFLDGVDHSFHYELKRGELNEEINAFVHDHEADMLCLIRRPRGFFERFFRSSVTQKKVFQSPVPLLVLMERA
ncbi:MAG: universal stress protein [Saprospirales bacterium]|nr:universal stress protein [Saprospirales bacterium]MBK8493033.1 universal stress protein [Saprospirales bacterium]